MASKNTKCKHGLNEIQEIEARKLRSKLAIGDLETIKMFHNMLLDYLKNSKGSYPEYIKEKDPVYYSAFIREAERVGPKELYQKICNC